MAIDQHAGMKMSAQQSTEHLTTNAAGILCIMQRYAQSDTLW